MTRNRAALVAAVVVFGAGAWWLLGRSASGRSLDASTAHLAIEWRGTSAGRMTLPARLNWCPVTHVGVLEAVSGDSGVAIVLYERDAISPGVHPVTSPEAAVSAPKPGATIAMRWIQITTDTAIAGFRSQSGALHLQLVRGAVSGDISARMRSGGRGDTITVHAVFTRVPVVATAVGCT